MVDRLIYDDGSTQVKSQNPTIFGDETLKQYPLFIFFVGDLRIDVEVMTFASLSSLAKYQLLTSRWQYHSHLVADGGCP